MGKAQKPRAGMRQIADRLERARHAFGLNQAAWCRRVGITPNAWNQYESAERRISLDQAIKLCDATGLTLEYIYRGQLAGMSNELATKIQAEIVAARRTA